MKNKEFMTIISTKKNIFSKACSLAYFSETLSGNTLPGGLDFSETFICLLKTDWFNKSGYHGEPVWLNKSGYQGEPVR